MISVWKFTQNSQVIFSENGKNWTRNVWFALGGQGSWSIESYGIATKYVYCRPHTVVLYLFLISKFNWKSTFTHNCPNMFGPKCVFVMVRWWNSDESLVLTTRKWYDTKQSSPRKCTFLACPLLDRMNPNVQKNITMCCNPKPKRSQKINRKCCCLAKATI